MEIFKASVQYNDLKGSLAADRADQEGAVKWLKYRNLINDDEFVVGIKMFAGENHGKHHDPVCVEFFVTDLKGYSDIPSLLEAGGDLIDARKINMDMDLLDFFALFKRLEISLSNGGRLEGKSFPSE